MAQNQQSNAHHNAHLQRRTFVLLFDGTGNKFSGTDSDSNILKILRMLDRNDTRQVHYYQPGIGTYVQSNTYSHTSVVTRAGSWVKKARDAAIGASFDTHVMGGYKFLMRHYNPGDDLYIFGFSRGAYTARYLSEMLDYVGLLEAGNEELARFAWKAFEKWQRRLESTEQEKKEKRAMFEFMKAFRDTFARPVKRIKFLGLFDTVNSVSQFESRFMLRSKHPYTATSSAIVIRHAVSIDERRAKFRQDLCGQQKPKSETQGSTFTRKRPAGIDPKTTNGETTAAAANDSTSANGFPKTNVTNEKLNAPKKKEEKPADVEANPRFRRTSVAHIRQRSADRGRRGLSPARSLGAVPEDDAHSNLSGNIQASQPPMDEYELEELVEEEHDEALPQDILEVWFAGGHGDIGGGWIPKKREALLSHIPLVWMVREAQKAGLRFDPERLEEMNCGWEAAYDDDEATLAPGVPEVHVTGTDSPKAKQSNSEKKESFHKHLHRATTQSIIHDCLAWGGGLSASGVAAWKFMEYLPFRRMDLQPDNTWESVRFPLPMGETRDMPDSAIIHGSVIRRMQADPFYRPGNLIVGGGGRGVKVAPDKYGMGEWDVVREPGDLIGECFIRRHKTCTDLEEKDEKKTKPSKK